MRSFFLLGLIAACAGCTLADRDFALQDVPCDAGPGVEGVLDAGFCAPAPEAAVDFDSGLPGQNDALACEPLVLATCGAAGECTEDPGCVAAGLLQRFEPESCDAALGDARSFPPCTQGACDRLVDKVCAVGCLDAPGCTPAQTLQARADDGDASAEGSCGTALADESLFPPCGS